MRQFHFGVIFTCGRVGLHIGRVHRHRRRKTINSLFGQQLKYWFVVASVTTCDKCQLR